MRWSPKKTLGLWNRRRVAGFALSVAGLAFGGLGVGEFVRAACGAPWSPENAVYLLAAGTLIGLVGFSLLVIVAGEPAETGSSERSRADGDANLWQGTDAP